MKKTIYVLKTTPELCPDESYYVSYGELNDIPEDDEDELVGVYELVRTERFRVNRYLEEDSDA